ncbi:MAG: FixH family protein [Paracoccaceae bacterium]
MTDTTETRAKELTGRHVLAICLGAFAVILTANISMLVAATGSFPGLVVKNSYVASQGWNNRTVAQAALGWQTALVETDGTVTLTVRDAEGRPVRGLALAATIGRPATDAEDRAHALADTDNGYRADAALAPGLWRVAVTGQTADGTPFETAGEIFVPNRN